MQRLTIFLLVLIAACSSPIKSTTDWNEVLNEVVESHDLNGVVVFRDADSERVYFSDSTRAIEGFIPASTFKIPNALIALEEGIVQSVTADTFRWDGQERAVQAWNSDHTLASGMQKSVVWLYQDIARMVGQERYGYWLERLDYGNRNAGGGVDLFWLTGDLRISAVQQTEFLSHLDRLELPFKKAHQDTVISILNMESTDQYLFRYKTGWAGRDGQDDIGWIVGIFEFRDGRRGYLALNIDMPDDSYAEKRLILAKAVLSRLAHEQ